MLSFKCHTVGAESESNFIFTSGKQYVDIEESRILLFHDSLNQNVYVVG